MNILSIKEYLIYYNYIMGTDVRSRQAISWRIRNSKKLVGVEKVIRKGNVTLLQCTEECYNYVLGRS